MAGCCVSKRMKRRQWRGGGGGGVKFTPAFSKCQRARPPSFVTANERLKASQAMRKASHVIFSRKDNS